ncbi:hypothetical protein CH304_00390 [Rhodococcus sp. 15-649-1-2]|nr:MULTISPECIES: hypothetical protein [unclassified Rhodococcus (in: high G+C Gram-positive bacteria)]OZC62327.1 hypothetical protein CH267_01980 [Rhodococcus sp. 06-621-2]OZE88063.1 hypothetical protein CH304_00390 [Rhodococcus sp. 15-649-1-2]
MTTTETPTDRTDLADLRHWVDVLVHVKAKKAELAELEKNAKAEIQNAMGDRTVGTLDGHAVVKWSTTKRTALSQTLLKKLHPEAAAECMETTEVRRFEVLDS